MIKNIAHRGFSGKYPENTMLAFEKALEAGCTGMEFDVHLTKDDVLVIIHDEMLDRTTNGTGFVKDYTYDELCAFDASADYKGVYGFQKIPTLREYFQLVQNHKELITNIELKTGIFEYPDIEKKTIAMIDEFGLRRNMIISSFNHYSILRCQKLASDIKLAFLEESCIIDMGAYTKHHGVQCIHPFFPTLTPERLGEMKANGREINAWTVNEEQYVRMLVKAGVDGIIGNFPDMVKRVLEDS
ncbi:MAG: glycerophosphodiester phosphodiesterase [Angelakisella sp.]